jgi:ornithine carbamoyltransferase
MRHFLDFTDWTTTELQALLTRAQDLKAEWKQGGNPPLLAGKVLAMIFQKPSLRTRVSFDVAMLHLGGHALYISPSEISMGVRESVADVTRVLCGYTQGIMARVFAHADLIEMARWTTVPIINGLSDLAHPCQTLADFLTIQEIFGKLEGVHIAYVGDTNNVAQSLAAGAQRFGASLAIASPAAYGPSPAFVKALQADGLEIMVTQDPAEAVRGADVIYTDTWVSMGQEKETVVRRSIFPPYQVNAALLKHAPSHAIVMHCLPAHRGDELTDEVADGPQSALFQQAENRLHAQKAILVTLLTQ